MIKTCFGYFRNFVARQWHDTRDRVQPSIITRWQIFQIWDFSYLTLSRLSSRCRSSRTSGKRVVNVSVGMLCLWLFGLGQCSLSYPAAPVYLPVWLFGSRAVLSTSRLPGLRLKRLQHDKQPLFSSLLCQDITEKRHCDCNQSPTASILGTIQPIWQSETWAVAWGGRYIIAQSSRTRDAGSRSVIPDLQSITWLWGTVFCGRICIEPFPHATERCDESCWYEYTGPGVWVWVVLGDRTADYQRSMGSVLFANWAFSIRSYCASVTFKDLSCQTWRFWIIMVEVVMEAAVWSRGWDDFTGPCFWHSV